MTEEPYRLDQTLLVAPGAGFARIDQALQALGWIRDERRATTPATLPGEVELAGWTRPGGHPVLTYTFNPVALLRVLDVGSVEPRSRAEIAAALPLLQPDEIEVLLQSTGARERLRGVLAARETERVDLADPVAALRADPEPAVAHAAADATEALSRVSSARLQALATLELIHGAAEPVIRRISGEDAIAAARSLRPSQADCWRLFRPRIAEHVTPGLDRLWERSPMPPQADPAHALRIAACPAGMFRTHNELSALFPRGYRDSAGWMDPRRVWVRWWHVSPGGSSKGFDGLAWVDDHWVLFPEPWRVVSEALGEGAPPTVH